jgi:hypothetical protein
MVKRLLGLEGDWIAIPGEVTFTKIPKVGPLLTRIPSVWPPATQNREQMPNSECQVGPAVSYWFQGWDTSYRWGQLYPMGPPVSYWFQR